MPPDFLSSREDAALVCIAAVIDFAVVKDPRGIASSVGALVRAAPHPKLLLLFGSAALYNAGLVYAANEANIWHSGALKETAYWFIGTAIVLVGGAVTQAAPGDTDMVKQVLARVFAVTVLIEFIANLYALPLGYELVLVPLAFLFVAMRVIAPRRAASTNGLSVSSMRSSRSSAWFTSSLSSSELSATSTRS
jgi:hypothetical protein